MAYIQFENHRLSHRMSDNTLFRLYLQSRRATYVRATFVESTTFCHNVILYFKNTLLIPAED